MDRKEMIRDVSTMTCKEIFGEILSKQVHALMFHDQMASYFDFLGLNGFKRMHEYQYLSESVTYRKVQRYFINRYNEIVESHDVENPHAIPSEWLKHTRGEVTPSIKKRSVKEAFEDYREWEKSVEECFSVYAQSLYDRGMLMDYSFVLDLIKDVCKEVKRIDRLMLKLGGVEYDLTYVEEMQDCLHEKYKKKIHRVGSEL